MLGSLYKLLTSIFPKLVHLLSAKFIYKKYKRKHTHRLFWINAMVNNNLHPHLVFIDKSTQQYFAKCDGCDGLNQKSDSFQKLCFDPSQATPSLGGRIICIDINELLKVS